MRYIHDSNISQDHEDNISQEDCENPQDYVPINSRCVYHPGTKSVEEKLLVNIDGERCSWVCKTCQGYMKRSRMPPTSHKNKLSVKNAPQLQRLSKFDNMLIAKKIPFMFISRLAVSRMDALKGKVILVPIQEEDIHKTIEAGQTLPRTPGEAGLVTYELRKKQEYRQTVGRPQLVNPKWLEEALQVLNKAGNSHYQLDYDKLEGYRQRCIEEDFAGAGVAFPEVYGEREVNMSVDDEIEAPAQCA